MNSSCKLALSIASAVFSVSSGQSFSGMSISVFEVSLYLNVCQLIVMLMIPTSQTNICFWRAISIKDFREINFLKSDFSIFSGFAPLNCIIHIFQFARFLDYLTIKFGEYYHQRNCESVNYLRDVPLDKLPFPVPLLKNSSSAGRMGRVPSIGIQYLFKHG